MKNKNLSYNVTSMIIKNQFNLSINIILFWVIKIKIESYFIGI
jgi:hypothetical protein